MGEAARGRACHQWIKGFTDTARRTNFVRPLLCVDACAHDDERAEFARKPPAVQDWHAHIEQRERHSSAIHHGQRLGPVGGRNAPAAEQLQNLRVALGEDVKERNLPREI